MSLYSLHGLLNNAPLPPPQRTLNVVSRFFQASAMVTMDGRSTALLKAESRIKLEGDDAIFFDALHGMHPYGVLVCDTQQGPVPLSRLAKADAIRFVAGVPILSSEQIRIGALWLLDCEPHIDFGAMEMATLRDFAGILSLIFELPLLANQALETEMAMEVSETRFRRAADCAPAPIWTLRADGEVQFLNKSALEFCGVAPADIDAHDWLQYLHPEDAPHVREEFLEAFQHRMPCHQELRLRRADGQYRWFSVDATPVYREDSRFSGYVGIMTDISDHKNREERLSEDVVRLAQIVESADDAIFAHDMDGTITVWNRAAERLFGYRAEEAIGRRNTMLAPAGRESEIQAFMERSKMGESFHSYRAARRRKDGSEVMCSIRPSPIYGEEGQVVGVSVIYRSEEN